MVVHTFIPSTQEALSLRTVWITKRGPDAKKGNKTPNVYVCMFIYYMA